MKEPAGAQSWVRHGEKMKKQYGEALSVAGAFLVVALLYIPFRLFAQRFNMVFAGHTDDF